jgi:hypothetical protein
MNNVNCRRVEGRASCNGCDSTTREAAYESLIDLGMNDESAGVTAEYLQRRASALFDAIQPATLVDEVVDRHMQVVVLTCETRRQHMVGRVIDLAMEFKPEPPHPE